MDATTDLEVLIRHVPVAGLDVVDVGCGAGGLASGLAGHGARVTGIEISDEQLVAARDRDDAAAVTFAVGRAEALPLADASQDLVVFMRSLHHVEIHRMSDALREARRVLRPGGSVWVAEPVPKGAFFEMVSLIEDETEARAAAERAVAGAAEQGLRREAGEGYAVAGVYPGVEAFRAHMEQVDSARAGAIDRHHAELQRLFAAGGEPTGEDGSRRFEQFQRADLLRAV
jgi:ubiquinone/menaquinone biosynthesis C-methylase UbiE